MTQIEPADVQWFLSSPTASSGYSLAGSAGASLGRWMSTSQISSTPLDDLFTDITPGQNVALQVDYQCLFVANMTTTGLTALQPYIWLPTSLYTGSATIMFAVDPAGVTPINSSSAQAQGISNSTTQPVVTGWSAPSGTFTQGISIGDLPPNYCQAVWFQRTATNGLAGSSVGFSVQCVFVTPA